MSAFSAAAFDAFLARIAPDAARRERERTRALGQWELTGTLPDWKAPGA